MRAVTSLCGLLELCGRWVGVLQTRGLVSVRSSFFLGLRSLLAWIAALPLNPTALCYTWSVLATIICAIHLTIICAIHLTREGWTLHIRILLATQLVQCFALKYLMDE